MGQYRPSSANEYAPIDIQIRALRVENMIMHLLPKSFVTKYFVGLVESNIELILILEKQKAGK
jgi:hypothetical protein